MATAERFWDYEELVGEIPKSDHSTYRVHWCEKGSRQYITLREWYTTERDPEPKPSKKGLSIRAEDAEAVAGAILRAKGLPTPAPTSR